MPLKAKFVRFVERIKSIATFNDDERRYPRKGREWWPNGERINPFSPLRNFYYQSDVTLIDAISSAVSESSIEREDSYYGISVRVSNYRYRYVVHFITTVYYESDKDRLKIYQRREEVNLSWILQVEIKFLSTSYFLLYENKFFWDIYNTETFPPFIFARGTSGSELSSIFSV